MKKMTLCLLEIEIVLILPFNLPFNFHLEFPIFKYLTRIDLMLNACQINNEALNSPYVIRQGFHYSQHHYNQAMIKLFPLFPNIMLKIC